MKKTLLLTVLVLAIWISPDSAAAQGQGLANVCSGPDCSACNLIDLGNRLITWLIGVITVLFAVLMVVAGFGLITSGGNQSALQAAKSKFTNALIGFMIVLAAWLLIDTLMRGLIGNNGNITGWGPWSQVQCWSQTAMASLPEPPAEDSSSSVTVAPSPGGHCPIGYTFDAFGSCALRTGPVLPDAGGNCPIGYTFDAFGSCIVQSGPISPDAGGNCPAGYTHNAFGDCEFNSSGPGNVTPNSSMNPIFDPAHGGSHMAHSDAAQHMQATLAGPFASLQQNFGRSVVINDAIAKSGSSRETKTPGSRHFHGDALDLSTAGMSNADKIRLYNAARQAGFTGFGFGNNILHVDTRPNRTAWTYPGVTSYGGRNVQDMIAEAKR